MSMAFFQHLWRSAFKLWWEKHPSRELNAKSKGKAKVEDNNRERLDNIFEHKWQKQPIQQKLEGNMLGPNYSLYFCQSGGSRSRQAWKSSNLSNFQLFPFFVIWAIKAIRGVMEGRSHRQNFQQWRISFISSSNETYTVPWPEHCQTQIRRYRIHINKLTNK